ncbi:hypothetical protein Pla100_56390 [Neorhodopirellula pilleata]|uniref:RNA polymerase sigma factor n=1 Tax=Neorhodopirellula pilleata TaxID=2714738 RepID=A0A5C5ZP84_9BACT|nr:hypothetical protein Pla100_56390 [Neorhodopirellula pilleata]
MLDSHDLARQLVNHFCEGDCDVETLAKRIDYHAAFIPEEGVDGIAALMFIECSNEIKDAGKLSLHKITMVLSRVQKQIYRSCHEPRTESLDFIDPIEVTRSTSSDDLRSMLKEIESLLSFTELILFQMRFVDGLGLEQIAYNLGHSKSRVHRDVLALRQRLIEKLT